MGKFIDLTNHVFGKLTIIERAENTKQGKVRWKAICQCGKEVIVTRNELRSGDSQSCGCLRVELLKINLKNHVFGKLKVLEEAEKKGKSSSQFWRCLCECGNEHIVSSQHLRENQVKSCGCLRQKSEEELLDEAKYRFWQKVEKTETCWLWKGILIKGYGAMFHKKIVKAHRFSYQIHNGKIEENKLICHTCDNPICVNPEHLFAGTAKDNTQDCIRKGRFKSRKK